MMAVKILYSLIFFNLALSCYSQKTVTFKTIDAKRTFQDIMFGQEYHTLKSKMQLSEIHELFSLQTAAIKNTRYLTVGIYKAKYANASFNESKRLYAITWSIDGDRYLQADVFKYFHDAFGNADSIKSRANGRFLQHEWHGKNIEYAISNVGMLSTSRTITITLRIKEQIQGEIGERSKGVF